MGADAIGRCGGQSLQVCVSLRRRCLSAKGKGGEAGVGLAREESVLSREVRE